MRTAGARDPNRLNQLYKGAEQREKRLQEARAAKEAQEMAECSFAPKGSSQAAGAASGEVFPDVK